MAFDTFHATSSEARTRIPRPIALSSRPQRLLYSQNIILPEK